MLTIGCYCTNWLKHRYKNVSRHWWSPYKLSKLSNLDLNYTYTQLPAGMWPCCALSRLVYAIRMFCRFDIQALKLHPADVNTLAYAEMIREAVCAQHMTLSVKQYFEQILASSCIVTSDLQRCLCVVRLGVCTWTLCWKAQSDMLIITLCT